MKYYLISGEASGDLHGSNLMKELKHVDVNADFRFWGGDQMASQGGVIVKHYRDHAYMGFFKVIGNLPAIFRNIRNCTEDIIKYKPDVLILIDYPGFNLRIARSAFKSGIRVFYYISPTVWAWQKSRVEVIKKYVERLFVILPFEKKFYHEHGYNVDFEGHPLIDAIDFHFRNLTARDVFFKTNNLPDLPLIALLPGSRKQEIQYILPVMMDLTHKYPGYTFVIAGAPSIEKEFYEKVTGISNIKIIYDQTYSLVQYSEAALVTSGTATLETALLGTPEVVCYKTGRLTIFIARLLVHVQFISLVNLILEKEAVKELLQDDLNPECLKTELDKIIGDSNYRNEMKEEFVRLKMKLGGPGASRRIAEKIVSLLNYRN